MSKIRKLASETALYGLGSIVPRALNFLLVPLHTRNLFSPEEYGVSVNLLAYVGFLNIVYTFGMETAYFRFATAQGADTRKVFNISQTSVLLISVILTSLFILLATPIADFLKIGDHPEFIVWLALVMLIDASVAIPFAKLRLEKRPIRFAVAKIINIMIVIGFNFYFLKVNYNPSVGIGFIFLATLIANGFYLLYFVKDIFSWRPVFDEGLSARMFRYAYPVMLMGLVGMTNEMFSRLTLEWWLPKGFYGPQDAGYALGVFGACYKYAVLMSIAIQAFRFAAEPFFFSNASDRNSPELFARVNHYFVVVCCFLLLVVSVNMDIFKYFIGEEYWSGINIVPILLLAYLFLGMYYNFSVWFKVTDRTYWGTIITAGGALLTIGLNFILIPIAGYTGSCWATLIVYLLMAMTCYFLGQRYYPVPYRIASDFAYILITTALIYAVSTITVAGFWLGVGFHAMIVVIWAGAAYLIEKRPVIAGTSLGGQ